LELQKQIEEQEEMKQKSIELILIEKRILDQLVMEYQAELERLFVFKFAFSTFTSWIYLQGKFWEDDQSGCAKRRHWNVQIRARGVEGNTKDKVWSRRQVKFLVNIFHAHIFGSNRRIKQYLEEQELVKKQRELAVQKKASEKHLVVEKLAEKLVKEHELKMERERLLHELAAEEERQRAERASRLEFQRRVKQRLRMREIWLKEAKEKLERLEQEKKKDALFRQEVDFSISLVCVNSAYASINFLDAGEIGRAGENRAAQCNKKKSKASRTPSRSWKTIGGEADGEGGGAPPSPANAAGRGARTQTKVITHFFLLTNITNISLAGWPLLKRSGWKCCKSTQQIFWAIFREDFSEKTILLSLQAIKVDAEALSASCSFVHKNAVHLKEIGAFLFVILNF
jgi:hypothetical protein